MRASKKPPAHKTAKPVVQWDVGQLVKFYRNGWHYGRVVKIGRMYTTVSWILNERKLLHEEIRLPDMQWWQRTDHK